MFVKGVVFVTILVGSLAVPTPEESDFFTHADTSARVVGGQEAADGSVPYMVALTTGVLLRSFMCGGSLVSQRTVLTAAHCVEGAYGWNSLVDSLRVTVGTNRWNQGGQIYSVARNVTHRHYVSATIKNDIGLLITSQDVVLSPVVSPVKLDFSYIPGGVQTYVAGWGRIRHLGPISATLLQLFAETIDGQKCVDDAIAASETLNMRAPPVEPHIELCKYHSPNHGMCNGDSGSALVRADSREQIGIVSWGFPCARGAPDMFARVSAFQDWLEEHIQL